LKEILSTLCCWCETDAKLVVQKQKQPLWCPRVVKQANMRGK
jgi:hypothetical protein